MAFDLRALDPSIHRDNLLSIWEENFSVFERGDMRALLERRFSWFYGAHPIRPPTTWIAFKNPQSDEIMGCASIYPRRILYRGQPYTVGVASDFAVSKRNRVFGPALPLQRAIARSCDEEGFDFILAFPNKTAKQVFLRVGYEEVGETRRWVKPLKTSKQVAKRISGPLAVEAVSAVADRGLSLLDDLRRLRRLPRVLLTRAEITMEVDYRYGEFWNRAGDQDNITCEKSEEYLRWRYQELPTENTYFFSITERRRDQLAGWIVFNVRDNQVQIQDMLAPDSQAMKILLLEFAHHARQKGYSSISVVCLDNPELKLLLTSLLFFETEHERQILAFFGEACPPELKSAVLDNGEWCLYEGGMDI